MSLSPDGSTHPPVWRHSSSTICATASVSKARLASHAAGSSRERPSSRLVHPHACIRCSAIHQPDGRASRRLEARGDPSGAPGIAVGSETFTTRGLCQTSRVSARSYASLSRSCCCCLASAMVGAFSEPSAVLSCAAMALAAPPLPSHGHRVCPRKGADDVGHRICARSACVHHTTSAGPAVRVSLVKPGADLSASSDRDNAPALPAVRGI